MAEVKQQQSTEWTKYTAFRNSMLKFTPVPINTFSSMWRFCCKSVLCLPYGKWTIY